MTQCLVVEGDVLYKVEDKEEEYCCEDSGK